MICAVLFDLDETLFDRSSAVADLIRGQHHRFDDIAQCVAPETYLQHFVALDQHGYTKREQVYNQLLERYGLSQDLHPMLLADWRTHYVAGGKGFAGVHEMLAALKSLGLRLGMITNGDAVTQQAKIDQLALAPYFDHIVISGALGVHKPDPRIFQHALSALAVRPSEAIFVGDNPTADIQGAQSVGMRAIWKRDVFWGQAPTADAAIEHLLELPILIHQMTQLPDDK